MDAQLASLDALIHSVETAPPSGLASAPKEPEDPTRHPAFAGLPPDILPPAPDKPHASALPEISLGEPADHFDGVVEIYTRKTTVSFKSDVYEELLAAHGLVRDFLPAGEELGVVSKSAIVNAAVKLMVTELKLRKKHSLLLKQIARDAITP